MNQFWESLVTIALAITGIAFLAVLVSSRSQTSSLVSASGAAFSESLEAAEAPVTGSFGTEAPGLNAYV